MLLIALNHLRRDRQKDEILLILLCFSQWPRKIPLFFMQRGLMVCCIKDCITGRIEAEAEVSQKCPSIAQMASWVRMAALVDVSCCCVLPSLVASFSPGAVAVLACSELPYCAVCVSNVYKKQFSATIEGSPAT